MVTQKPKPKLTYEDYAKTPDDERWELIDGELINRELDMAPPAKEAHQRNQMQLGSRMFFSPTKTIWGESIPTST